MVKVKSVHLVNYCGYTDCTFDFTYGDGVLPFSVFFGPNGIGKSTCLDAIRMAGAPNALARGGNLSVMLRKFVHDEEYLPGVDAVAESKVKNHMIVEVHFLTEHGIKRVIIDNDGVLVNELPPTSMKGGYVYFADADNPMSTGKFMLAAEHADKFLDFTRAVYGYECSLASPVSSQGVKFFTDFVIRKGSVKVHFKRMSAGEKKIATLVSDLCQPIYTTGRDIVLVDNVEMHVYWKRHTRMIDKLRAIFPDKQLITTTHSSHVIDHIEPDARFDLEEYRPDYKLMELQGVPERELADAKAEMAKISSAAPDDFFANLKAKLGDKRSGVKLDDVMNKMKERAQQAGEEEEQA